MNYEKLFEDSYARIIGEGVGIGDKGHTFFSMFYDIFFSKSQQIRDKFADVDMDAQVRVLQKSMFHIIGFYATKTDSEYLATIAHTHSRDQYDIRPEFYDIWLESLIETVQQLDPEYEENLGLAVETVSRVFTRLQNNKVLKVEGKEVEILDRKYLCGIANNDCPNL